MDPSQFVRTRVGATQKRVFDWCATVFGAASTGVPQRTRRFLEEAVELAQSTGMTEEDALKMVRFVYARPTGEPSQEIGGTMVTLMSLSTALQVEVWPCLETELARCESHPPEYWQARHAAKRGVV